MDAEAGNLNWELHVSAVVIFNGQFLRLLLIIDIVAAHTLWGYRSSC